MSNLSRDQIAEMYFRELPYQPYPVQEEAMLAWFTSEQGVLVCAPTGMGKTLIAHAGLYEALHTGKTAYYTTPLIALTEQKFREIQERALSWGFGVEDVGLVTGNRSVNPGANVLVVVAEILLNRLLHPEAFDFDKVTTVVMDEFHYFSDPERGIVWELALSMLPEHIRLLLLSATVGNSAEFVNWLKRCHHRKIELVENDERRVPLVYEWVPDKLLGEQAVEMAKGDEQARRTPALVFCFNREQCWSVAEQFKGLPLVSTDQKTKLHAEVNKLDWSQGVGPKMKQLLHRGVAVHHAGLLPKYRRVVENLFERKLLSFAICTETLAAGINLPARSVVLPRLVKGPPGKERLIEASAAHQIFGRAGRPQFDDRGYVVALAHEDDVKILRWKEQYDAIPENSKDPNLIKAKKKLKKKKPTRSDTRVYWSEGQFQQLQAAKPGKLYSKGPLPWRLLAYMLKISPEVERIRKLIRKRLMDEPRIQAGEKDLDRMLLTLSVGGFVKLEPDPPTTDNEQPTTNQEPRTNNKEHYSPQFAHPTESLEKLLAFRGIHPLYGAFLLDHLGVASREERIQAFESVLEIPRSVLRFVRVPKRDDLPPGPLERNRLDQELLRRGLIPVHHTADYQSDEEEEEHGFWDEYEYPPTFADKLFLLFEARYPDVHDVFISSVWSAGELLRFNGNFNKYVQAKNLIKQEGIIFRHLLRLILLLGEFEEVTPAGTTSEEWRADLRDIGEQLEASCREVDPESTEKMIEQGQARPDVASEQEANPPSA